MDGDLQIVDLLDRYAERGERKGPSRVLESAREARALDRHYALGLDLGEWWRLPTIPLELAIDPTTAAAPRRAHPVLSLVFNVTMVVVVVAAFFSLASVLVMSRPTSTQTTVNRDAQIREVLTSARNSAAAEVHNRVWAGWQRWSVHPAFDDPRYDPGTANAARAVRPDPQPEWPRHAMWQPGSVMRPVLAATVQGRLVYDGPGGTVLGTDYHDLGFVPRAITDAPGFDVLDLYLVKWRCAPEPAPDVAASCDYWKANFIADRNRYLGITPPIDTAADSAPGREPIAGVVAEPGTTG